MNWNKLNLEQKQRLLAYDKMLAIQNPTDDETVDLNLLAEYCTTNNLDIDDIPQKIHWTSTCEDELMRSGPDHFLAEYNFCFLDADNNVLDVREYYYKKNPKEKIYLEQIRKGKSHRDATEIALGLKEPDKETAFKKVEYQKQINKTYPLEKRLVDFGKKYKLDKWAVKLMISELVAMKNKGKLTHPENIKRYEQAQLLGLIK